jgi:hypothetical protein
MKSIAISKSTFTYTLFIITNALILNCSAAEPVTEKSLAITGLVHLVDTKVKPTSINARCAIIKNSGLTWELKTDDGGIHDKDNVYRWGGIGAEKTGTIFFDDWNNLLNATNTEQLCGFNDWRVPTIEELKTLVTNTERKPVIDTTIFSLTQAMPYWSVSTYQHYPEHAQTLDFATGTSNYYTGFRGDRLPVHLVRGNKKQ